MKDKLVEVHTLLKLGDKTYIVQQLAMSISRAQC